MRKDPTEFRKRFLRWKRGMSVYDGGVIIQEYEGGKDHQEMILNQVDDMQHPFSVDFIIRNAKYRPNVVKPSLVLNVFNNTNISESPYLKETTGGYYNINRDSITLNSNTINKNNVGPTVAHEIRHAMDDLLFDAFNNNHKYLTQQERQYIDSAYGDPGAFSGDLSEKIATNAEMRYRIQKNHGSVWGEKLDEVIDKSSDKEILSLLNTNAYINKEKYMLQPIPATDSILLTQDWLKKKSNRKIYDQVYKYDSWINAKDAQKQYGVTDQLMNTAKDFLNNMDLETLLNIRDYINWEKTNQYRRHTIDPLKAKAIREAMKNVAQVLLNTESGLLYALDGKDSGNYIEPSIWLPEVTVKGYSPIRLTTYYPGVSEYPYTGHSKLQVPIPAFEIGKDGFHVEYVDAGKVRVDPETGDVITKTGARGGLVLPEVTVSGKRANTKNSKLKYDDYLTASNDATQVISRNPNIRSIKPINPHLAERANQGAKAHAAWEEEHPILNTVGLGLSTIPFVAAASPTLAPVGEAFAGTTLAGISAPMWTDAALTAGFGAHGLDHAINEGIGGWGDAAMTALEVAPLGRLAKPIYNVGKPTANFVPTTESNMAGIRYAYNRNPELANIGTLEDYKKFMSSHNITVENAASMTPELSHFYHGSPVRFDTFSADFIGSGEGGSKVMRGINLWPVEKIANAPKFANIKSPDAPLHLGVSSTPLGGKLNPTVYDVSGRGLKLYTTTPREVKGLSQSDLISQGYDGIQTPNQVTVFPESIGKLSIDKQSTIDEFILSHPEVERWTPWTTDNQKMQNIIYMSKMSKWTPVQWTAAQDAAIARGDMAEAQRLRDLHFMTKAPNTFASINRKPLQLYHGTNSDFNAFDLSRYGSTDGGTFGIGVYTTPIQEYAKLYGKNNMPLYMKLDNPRDYRDYNIGDLMAEKLAFGEYFGTGNGIDGVIGRPSWKGFKGLEEYVSHNPKNIKSSKAVTYNDNGVRIPLGERDNFNINDIRYGLFPFGIGLTGYGLSNWNDVKFPTKRKIK